ncbi:MAG: hypothetical protein MJZ41_16165 [Bacteroidaceae bacterium]|nr:hypothetical protein [Bacteroidaceae bacterium]
MPIVPEVDIDGSCTSKKHKKKVDSQTHRNDERAHCRVIRNRCCCRPSHVKHIERKAECFNNGRKCRAQRLSQETCDDSESDKTHTYKKSALEGFGELDADAATKNSEENWHHYGCTKPDNVCEKGFNVSKYSFHC